MLARKHSPGASVKGIFADLDGGVVVHGNTLQLIHIRWVHIDNQFLIPCKFLGSLYLAVQKPLVILCLHKVGQFVPQFHEQLILKLLLPVAGLPL